MSDRVCWRCQESMPADEFFPDGPGRGWRNGICKRCYSLQHGLTWRLKNTYGITMDDYHRMMERQRGLCAICRVEKAEHIDHCHATGVVRGVLCPNCNRLLGFAKDERETLRRASRYLARFQETTTHTTEPCPHCGRLIAARRLDVHVEACTRWEKACSTCGETKPLTEFGKHKGKADGLETRCRGCLNSANRKNRARYMQDPEKASTARGWSAAARRRKALTNEILESAPPAESGTS